MENYEALIGVITKVVETKKNDTVTDVKTIL